MPEDRMLSSAETAHYCQVPEETLAYWSRRGTGPRFYRVGRYRRYKRQDIDAWLETRASDRTGGAVA